MRRKCAGWFMKRPDPYTSLCCLMGRKKCQEPLFTWFTACKPFPRAFPPPVRVGGGDGLREAKVVRNVLTA